MTTVFTRASGTMIFQFRSSSWSMRTRGTVSRSQMVTKYTTIDLMNRYTMPSTGTVSAPGPRQPPRNNTVNRIAVKYACMNSAR